MGTFMEPNQEYDVYVLTKNGQKELPPKDWEPAHLLYVSKSVDGEDCKIALIAAKALAAQMGAALEKLASWPVTTGQRISSEVFSALPSIVHNNPTRKERKEAEKEAERMVHEDREARAVTHLLSDVFAEKTQKGA